VPQAMQEEGRGVKCTIPDPEEWKPAADVVLYRGLGKSAIVIAGGTV